MTRVDREKRTVSAMIALYCRANHSPNDELCQECAKLHDYTVARLDRCPLGVRKTTCAKCAIHCYKPDMRTQIKRVMRCSGPRMLRQHPLLALMHQLDSLRA